MTTTVVHDITIPAYTSRRDGERVEVPARTARVQFTIDLDAIYQRFGAQAMFNRAGQAIAMHGLIRAKVLT